MSRVTFPKQFYATKLKSPVASSQGLAFSLDSKRLYVSTVRHGVMCIDLKSRRRRQVKALGPEFYPMVPEHSASHWVEDPDGIPRACPPLARPDLSHKKIEKYAVSPEHSFVVILEQSGFTKDTRGKLKILDLPSLDERCEVEGYRRGTSPPGIHISADGSLIAISDYPDSVRILSSRDGSTVRSLAAFGENAKCLTLSENGNILAARCLLRDDRPSSRAGLWIADLDAEEQTPPIPVAQRSGNWDFSVISPDGRFAGGIVDNKAIVWRAKNILSCQRREAKARAKLRIYSTDELLNTTRHGCTLGDFFELSAKGGPRLVDFTIEPSDKAAKRFAKLRSQAVKSGRPPSFKASKDGLWPDVLMIKGAGLVFSEYAISTFSEAGFKGWRAFDVDIQDRKGKPAPCRYYGLAITGKAGRLLGKKEIEDPNEYRGFLGHHFDITTWDGSAFFMPENAKRLHITRDMVALLGKKSVTGWSAGSIISVRDSVAGPKPSRRTPESARRGVAVPPGKLRKPKVVGKPWARSRVKSFLDKHGLAATSGSVLDATIPTAMLRMRKPSKPDLRMGATRFGGYPDLPQDAKWPSWRKRQLAFLGQIRTSDFRSFDTMGLLPDAGLLSFFVADTDDPDFYDDRSADRWRVVYTDGDAQLVRRTCPDDLPGSGDYIPAAVNILPALSLPHWESKLVSSLKLNEADFESYIEAHLDYNEAIVKAKHCHKVLGWPDTLQADVASGCPKSRGKRAGSEWRLLLQLDSDELLGTQWGDMGRAYFMIREADAHARRYDRAVFVIQC